jgi:transcriptional regulator with XRE-family HTH domain
MSTVKTVRDLCGEHGLNFKQLAERAGLDERRVQAIVEGRWTPSPAERERVAGVFGLSPNEIAWGHVTPVQNLYGHGPQFGRTP